MVLDVVIPTWNRADLLAGCLESIERQDARCNIIVVDNGSSDGTRQLVATRFGTATVVALETNLGFGRAVNRGVAAGSAEIIVLLNNDVVLEEGFLERIGEPFERPGIGMVAGVLIDPRSGLIDAAGVEIDGGLAGYSYLNGKPRSSLAAPAKRLLGPCGGAAAYRRSAFEAVDGFDEQIFAYSEDVDLALRMRAAGWSCALAPSACALHLGSATLGARSVAQVRTAARSRGYLVARYRPRVRWLATELAVATVDTAVMRSTAPLAGRLQGWREGRRRGVPAVTPPELPALGWREAVLRRYRARSGARAS